MPIVCVNKPNRTHARPFTENDVKRIAGYVMENGVSPYKILAYVLVGLGLGALVCKFVKAIDNISVILEFFKTIGVITAQATVIKVVIEYLKRSPLSKVPRLNWIIAIIIVFLVLLESILERMSSTISDIQFIQDTAELLAETCKNVDELLNSS